MEVTSPLHVKHVRYTAPEYERTDDTSRAKFQGMEHQESLASTESLTALSVLSTESPQHIPP